MKECLLCGAENRDKAKYCRECGIAFSAYLKETLELKELKLGEQITKEETTKEGAQHDKLKELS